MQAILMEIIDFEITEINGNCCVPFSTTAISVDGKFKKFGIGVNIFNKAGDGKFQQ